MKQEDFVMLTEIYNAMLNIQTKGNDTLTMADCIRALKQLILKLGESEIKEN